MGGAETFVGGAETGTKWWRQKVRYWHKHSSDRKYNRKLVHCDIADI